MGLWAMEIRRARSSVLALAVAGLLAACGGSDDAQQPLDLTILHVNDHHSNLEAKSGSQGKSLTLQTGAAARTAVVVDAAGFPRVTKAFAELAAGKPNVLKLHAGDALTGTLYFNKAGAQGEADAALMNTVCFDAFTLGNHEFDKGDSGLKSFLDLLHKGTCKTPAISANVAFGAASALHASKAPGLVSPSTVLERGGQKIGVIGLTIAQKTKIASSPDADTTFEDEATAAQREIDRLKAQGINKIILMSHIGYELDKQVAAKLSGVDVVVGGDSHTLLGPDALKTLGVGTPSGSYPTVAKDKDGKTVCIVQAWEYSQVVGELKVSFDKDGNVTQCQGTPHVLIGDNFKVGGKDATEAERTAIRADIAASGLLRVTAPDTTAASVLKPFADKVDVFKKTEVSVVTTELCSRRVPGDERPANNRPGWYDYGRSSTACNAEGKVSARGGDIQQLVAQAYLEVANAKYGGADISLQSGGGVRIPLSGKVTAANVNEVLPFSNLLFRLDVTGAEVKGMLEDGLDTVFGASPQTGPYPYTGGLRFDVDASQPNGSRAQNLQVRDRATGNWVAVDPAKTYRLFVLSFNATGGDGYTTLKNVPNARRLDIGVLDVDVLFDYVATLPKDSASGLPLLSRLPDALYSTKSFKAPN